MNHKITSKIAFSFKQIFKLQTTNYKLLLLLLPMLLPAISFAAYGLPNPTTPESVNDIFKGFSEGNIMGMFPAIILAGVVTFLAGVVAYVTAGDDEEKKAGGRQVILYGLIVLFIMISAWGFVGLLHNSFFNEELSIPNYLPTPIR